MQLQLRFPAESFSQVWKQSQNSDRQHRLNEEPPARLGRLKSFGLSRGCRDRWIGVVVLYTGFKSLAQGLTEGCAKGRYDAQANRDGSDDPK